MALDLLSVLDMARFCVFFWFLGTFCLVHYLSIISTSAIDCLRRFVFEMSCYVLSVTLNLTN